MTNKKYRVNATFQSDKFVTVTAKNEREAKSEAQKKVSKMKIGNSIRRDWTDVQEY